MKDKKKIGVAAVLSIVPIVLIGGMTGVIVITAGVGLAFLLLAVANRSFGGISGDVFGATIELVRLSSLLIFASL